MGKQVNFYMHPDDLNDFNKMMRLDKELKMINNISQSKKPEVRESLTVTEYNKERLTIYLVQSKYINDVKMKFIAKQNYWLVDELCSAVIEFSRCYFDGVIMRRGRLYYQAGYYDENDNWKDKPEDFKLWADKKLSWIKKNYQKEKGVEFYVGSHAKEWKASGGKFLINN